MPRLPLNSFNPANGAGDDIIETSVFPQALPPAAGGDQQLQLPKPGRIVLYALSENDVLKINRRRDDARFHMDEHRDNANGVMVHVGNRVQLGDVFPMIITRVWGDGVTSLVNGSVMLDGSDTFWATSVGWGRLAGAFTWPER